MKLAIPVDEKNIEAPVSESFGRAPFFLIYNTDTQENTFVDNAAAASSGGAGIKAVQIIVDYAIHALLTPRCGQNAADVLKAADIQIYQSMPGSAKANIEAFEDNRLPILDEIHAGFHGGH
ncbi:MAG: dinitrogenase iron-molybdenum cofactor biosynthesis protein [Eubacteriaceae bacterium]|jgi:predicted Fe-Mo cluster-binding NifX family protein|nr:dinitrogenase iron-molybdenum cofactor biosynthesis protein [Eubacteriaceae bacterium]